MPSSRPLPGVLMLVPAGSEGEAVYNAPVAQPDRVVASEAIGRGFESLRARHLPLLPSALADPPPSRMPPATPRLPERDRQALQPAAQRHGRSTASLRARQSLKPMQRPHLRVPLDQIHVEQLRRIPRPAPLQPAPRPPGAASAPGSRYGCHRPRSVHPAAASARDPPGQRLPIAIDVAVINGVQRVLRDCLQQLATQAVLYAPAAVLRLSRQ